MGCFHLAFSHLPLPSMEWGRDTFRASCPIQNNAFQKWAVLSVEVPLEPIFQTNATTYVVGQRRTQRLRPATSGTKQASLINGFWEFSRCLLFYSCTLSLAELSAFTGSLCLAFWYFHMCEGCSHFVWGVHGGKHFHKGRLYNSSNWGWPWRRFGWLSQIHNHSSEGQVESWTCQALPCAWHRWQHFMYS